MGGFGAYDPMTNKKAWYNKEKFSACRYAERLRFGDSRAFISNLGFTGATEMMQSPLTSGWNSSSRLYGRSVWNTQWLLIVPGSTLSADKDGGLDRFIETVRDIQLYLETYSNQGM